MPGDSQTNHSQAGTAPDAGLVLVVGPPDRRRSAVAAVEALGRAYAEFDDPYAAVAELCRRPPETAALLLSLHGLYREELQLIPAVHRAHPHAEVWLTDIDARPAALAEAMRLGADGLLGEDGLHRLGGAAPRDPAASGPTTAATPTDGNGDDTTDLAPVQRVGGSAGTIHVPGRDAASRDHRSPFADPPPGHPRPAVDDDDAYGGSPGEPILTADELRALLHDQPDASPVPRDEG